MSWAWFLLRRLSFPISFARTGRHTRQASCIAGGILIVVSLFLKSNEIRAGMGRRSTKFGVNSGVSILLFVGVLVLVNYLGSKHQKRFDMTAEHLHSLGDESTKVLGELKERCPYQGLLPRRR